MLFFLLKKKSKMTNYTTVDVTGGMNFNINNNGLTIEDTDPIYVNTKGDIMHGNLNMNNHFIKNVGDPKEDNDVVTKKYLNTELNNMKKQKPKENLCNSTSQYKIFKFPLHRGNRFTLFRGSMISPKEFFQNNAVAPPVI